MKTISDHTSAEAFTILVADYVEAAGILQRIETATDADFAVSCNVMPSFRRVEGVAGLMRAHILKRVNTARDALRQYGLQFEQDGQPDLGVSREASEAVAGRPMPELDYATETILKHLSDCHGNYSDASACGRCNKCRNQAHRLDIEFPTSGPLMNDFKIYNGVHNLHIPDIPNNTTGTINGIPVRFSSARHRWTDEKGRAIGFPTTQLDADNPAWIA